MKELPYLFDPEIINKRWKEIKKNKEIPQECNCIPAKDYKISKGLTISVKNEKLGGIWIDHVGIEHMDLCPVCGTLLLVRAIKGTTYLACCSKKCYDKYFEYIKKKEGKEHE